MVSLRTLNPAQRRTVGIVCVLVIIGALAVIVINIRNRKPGTPQQLMFATLQRLIADKTANALITLVGPSAKVIVVRLDTSSLPKKEDLQFDNFMQAMRPHKDLAIVATELVDPEPIVQTSEFCWPSATLQKILKEHSDVDAIVSFVGPPKLTEAEILGLPDKRPKILAVSGLSYRVPVKMLMDRGIIQFAIIPLSGSRTDITTEPKTDQDWFDRYFELVTAKQTAKLPE